MTQLRQATTRHVRRKLLIGGLVTTLLAIGLPVLYELLAGKDKGDLADLARRLSIEVGITIAFGVALIGFALELVGRLSELETVDEHTRNASEIKLSLTKLSTKLEAHLGVQAQLEKVRGAEGPIRRAIQLIAESPNSDHSFFKECTEVAARRFQNVVGELTSGVFECPSEDEFVSNEMALDTCLQRLRAVSFQDVDFWLSEDGHVYLQRHSKLATRVPDIEITRIFILSSSDHQRLAKAGIYKEHIAASVRPYLAAQRPSRGKRDFVIYDDALVRIAGAPDRLTGRKRARFTSRDQDIADAEEDWRYLFDRARLLDGLGNQAI